jgi:hypothetical protein
MAFLKDTSKAKYVEGGLSLGLGFGNNRKDKSSLLLMYRAKICPIAGLN